LLDLEEKIFLVEARRTRVWLTKESLHLVWLVLCFKSLRVHFCQDCSCSWFIMQNHLIQYIKLYKH